MCQPKRTAEKKLIKGAKGGMHRVPMLVDHWKPPGATGNTPPLWRLTRLLYKESVTPCPRLCKFSSSTPSIKRLLSGCKQTGREKCGLVPPGFTDRHYPRSVALAVLLGRWSGRVVFTRSLRQTSECPLIDFQLWVDAALRWGTTSTLLRTKELAINVS